MYGPYPYKNYGEGVQFGVVLLSSSRNTLIDFNNTCQRMEIGTSGH